MFGQTFEPADLGVVGFLVVLEALLSADNALVLAIMVRHLPKKRQQKALLYGLGGAFVFRFLAILLASVIIALWWMQGIGALYLLALPFKHFLSHAQPKSAKEAGKSFWGTVIAVEVADIAFAIDSVLAGVATIGDNTDKIWVVYLGAIVGVVLLRFVAGYFIKLLDRFPLLDHVAYVIVGWVGVKLAFMSAHNFGVSHPNTISVHELSHVVFWAVLLTIAVVGTAIAVKHAKKDEEPSQADSNPGTE